MSTLDDNNDEQFSENAKTVFDDSVDRLDAATLSKLNQGRQAALAEIGTDSPARQWARWAPVTGAAAAALIAVVMMRGPGTVDAPDAPGSSVTDFEILISDDSLDMIEELEFYSWIEAAEPGDAG